LTIGALMRPPVEMEGSMRCSHSSVGLALLVWFGSSVPVAPVAAQQSSRATTMACSEQTTRIDGVGQRIRLTGECRTVLVSGSGHRVVVERAGSLNVSGMDNEVRWERSLQGEAPRIVNSGINNVVKRAIPVGEAGPVPAPAPSAKSPSAPPSVPAAPRAAAASTDARVREGDPLRVKQSGQTLRLDCASRPVSVSGSANTISLVGTCGQISVSGTGNRITVERAPRIVTTGHNNEIVWEHGDGDEQPSIRNSGRNNTVRRAGS